MKLFDKLLLAILIIIFYTLWGLAYMAKTDYKNSENQEVIE